MKTAVLIWILVTFSLLSGVAAADETRTDSPAVTMEEMVVTGDALSDQPLTEAPASVTIVTAEEIAASTARTVDDLLKTTVGVDVYKPWGMFGPSSHVRLRGFANPRATIFLRDGVPINRMVCGGAIHNEIPLDIVERVEVVRGANASLYGAGAMGGVINIVTQKPENRARASVDGSYGTHNTWTANAMVNGALTERLNLQVNYNHFDTDGYFAWADSWVDERAETMSLQNLASWEPVKDNYLSSLENQKREMDNFFAKLKFDVTPASTLNAAYSYWKNDNDIGYTYGHINQERNRGSIDYRHRGKFDLTANLFFLDENMAFSQPVLPAPWMTIGEGEDTWVVQGEKNDIPIRDGGGMLSLSAPIGRRHKLTIATDHRLVSTENKQYDGQTGQTQSISQGKQYKWGVVVQDAVTTGRLTSTFSLRYDAIRAFDFFSEDLTTYTDYADRSDDQLNPKIGFNYRWSDTTTLKASAGRVSTFPPLMYLIGNYETPPGRMMLGNPDLKTEYSYSYEIGVEQYFTSGVMFKATCFYNDIRDWMQEVTTNDPAYSSVSVRWENIEKARTAGVELEAEYYPTDDLKLFANYNYTHSKIVEFRDKGHNYKNSDLEGNRFPTQPYHRFNAGITWFNPRLATVNLSLRYVGDRYWDIENDVALDEFITVDVKISRKFASHLTASLEVTDLFDEAWQETEMHVTPGRMIMGRIKIEY
ncbi:catecholate siderophore receptor CirA [Desulfosarcina ovata subsp. sediminis]|uniref:Catecholate siderophore receptor CirA n=1 Tax=Desulfosarcina ovata subsp. sediminis TaxID=885957 RepID=A0A5K7ZU00_9BACT|nr:TonB-dependent receptor [Desulfosarcina ovata]BBO83654.1 catecholate siderophore receptor CirA [Desulfosarcina ovata subsp. sediminis]